MVRNSHKVCVECKLTNQPIYSTIIFKSFAWTYIKRQKSQHWSQRNTAGHRPPTRLAPFHHYLLWITQIWIQTTVSPRTLCILIFWISLPWRTLPNSLWKTKLTTSTTLSLSISIITSTKKLNQVYTTSRPRTNLCWLSLFSLFSSKCE